MNTYVKYHKIHFAHKVVDVSLKEKNNKKHLLTKVEQITQKRPKESSPLPRKWKNSSVPMYFIIFHDKGLPLGSCTVNDISL